MLVNAGSQHKRGRHKVMRQHEHVSDISTCQCKLLMLANKDVNI
jgi:hypothetical protein